MKRCDHLRAFTDAGRDAFDRAGADVADREDAAAARFELTVAVAEVGSGHHEAFRVELHVGLREPRGVRRGADEEKEMSDRAPGLCAAPAIPPADGFERARCAFE